MSQTRRGPESIRDLLAGRSLVVVSNREPYVHRFADGGVTVTRPAGGLVAALDPVMQATSGIWVAWGSGEADFAVTDARGCVAVPAEAPRYTLKRVHLSPEEVESYYYGYANQALWPLCHMAMEKARFRRAHWEMYQAANRRFADAVLEVAGPEPIVWVQDYHLALVPRYLRQARPDWLLMTFWHIPWPPWDVFRICPQRTELLDGLLGCDLIGLQRPRHVDNLLACAERELGARVDIEAGTIEYDGRLIAVEAFPISVDFAALDALARSAECRRWMARLRRQHGLAGRAVMLGVDRLDYTKGILERLRAYEVFLRAYPQHRGRVVFVQKAAPSRTAIGAYRELQWQVEAEIARLNHQYGSEAWQPVVYLPRPLPLEGMAALYRLADVCVVSSLQDGMNLVAKEYVAAQVDASGVLLLSELAGAHRELPWALTINPFDGESFADAMHMGLQMPADERRERMRHLRAYLAEHDIYAWMAAQAEAASRLLAARTATHGLLEHAGEIRTLLAARPPVLLVDFDGTLAPLAERPDLVSLPAPTGAVLRALAAADVPVAVISGRALDDVRALVGIPGLIYAGNHGLEIAGADWTWVHPQAAAVRAEVAAACARLRARLGGIPGVLIEDKGLSASVHYRGTPRARVEEVQAAVFEEIGRLPERHLVVRHGKLVLEIRPAADWDKGTAARWLLERLYGADWPVRVCPIYLGDDRTDEDAFRALAADGVTVKVGRSAGTAARFVVLTQAGVQAFLELLAGWVRGGQVPASPAAPPEEPQTPQPAAVQPPPEAPRR